MYVKCKIYRICTINVSYGICVNTCQTSKSYIKKKTQCFGKNKLFTMLNIFTYVFYPS